MNAIRYKGLTLGQQAEITRAFTADDIHNYTDLTGDSNFDSGTIPGPLLGGMISNLLGTQLPGRGTNWLKQRYVFPHPARVGEPITASVTISRLRPEKDLVNLTIACVDSWGVIVCRGESLVLVADLEPAEA